MEKIRDRFLACLFESSMKIFNCYKLLGKFLAENAWLSSSYEGRVATLHHDELEHQEWVPRLPTCLFSCNHQEFCILWFCGKDHRKRMPLLFLNPLFQQSLKTS